MKLIHILATAITSFGLSAFAQTPSPDHAAHHAAASSVAEGGATEGEVRKVDKEQGKVTLKHGPIANLEMSSMTMVFKAADPRMLDSLQEGDKVKFAAERVNGVLTVTAIEVTK